MKVEVYFNLHKHLFSVRSYKNGRVFAHATMIRIKDPMFVVRQSGRKQVLREQKKNVHAFVRGKIGYDVPNAVDEMMVQVNLSQTTSVIYNPYKYASFVEYHTEMPVYSASQAWLGLNNGKPFIEVEGVNS